MIQEVKLNSKIILTTKQRIRSFRVEFLSFSQSPYAISLSFPLQMFYRINPRTFEKMFLCFGCFQGDLLDGKIIYHPIFMEGTSIIRI